MKAGHAQDRPPQDPELRARDISRSHSRLPGPESHTGREGDKSRSHRASARWWLSRRGRTRAADRAPAVPGSPGQRPGATAVLGGWPGPGAGARAWSKGTAAPFKRRDSETLGCCPGGEGDPRPTWGLRPAWVKETHSLPSLAFRGQGHLGCRSSRPRALPAGPPPGLARSEPRSSAWQPWPHQAEKQALPPQWPSSAQGLSLGLAWPFLPYLRPGPWASPWKRTCAPRLRMGALGQSGLLVQGRPTPRRGLLGTSGCAVHGGPHGPAPCPFGYLRRVRLPCLQGPHRGWTWPGHPPSSGAVLASGLSTFVH